MEKNIKSRIKLKIDTPENWGKATNFIPLEGEAIVYKDEDFCGVKFGDGVTLVGDLPFSKGEHPDLIAGAANQLNPTIDVTEEASFNTRTTASMASITSGQVKINSIKGNMIKWSQLFKSTNDTKDFYGVTYTKLSDCHWHIEGTPTSDLNFRFYESDQAEANAKIIFTPGHKYFISFTKSAVPGINFNIYKADASSTDLFNTSSAIVFKYDMNNSTDALLVRANPVAGAVGYMPLNLDVYINIHDLTDMFGAGNELKTVAECRRFFTQDEYQNISSGEYILTKPDEIYTEGFNLCPLEIASIFEKHLDGYYNTLSSEDITKVKAWIKKLQQCNQELRWEIDIDPLPSPQPSGPDTGSSCGGILFRAANAKKDFYLRNFKYFPIDGHPCDWLWVNGETGWTLRNFPIDDIVTIAIYGKARVDDQDVPSTLSNACMHFVWSGTKNNHYEKPWDSALKLPVEQYFPNGMGKIKANSQVDAACDEINFVEHQATKRIRCIEDLSKLNWSIAEETFEEGVQQFYVADFINLNIYFPEGRSYLANMTTPLDFSIKSGAWRSMQDKTIGTANSGHELYLGSASCTSVEDLKTLLAGVKLYYEDANPEVIPLPQDIENTYRAEDFGIEKVKQYSDIEPIVPATFNLSYKANLHDKLQHLPDLPSAGNGEYIIEVQGMQMYLKKSKFPATPNEAGKYNLICEIENNKPNYLFEEVKDFFDAGEGTDSIVQKVAGVDEDPTRANVNKGENGPVFGRRNTVEKEEGQDGPDGIIMAGVSNTIGPKGKQAAATGHNNYINGRAGSVGGSGNQMLADYGNARGRYTRVGQYAIAGSTDGIGTEVSNIAERAVGQYNETNDTSRFSVGNGTNNDNKHNAFEVGGSIGNEYVKVGDETLALSDITEILDFLNIQKLDYNELAINLSKSTRKIVTIPERNPKSPQYGISTISGNLETNNIVEKIKCSNGINEITSNALINFTELKEIKFPYISQTVGLAVGNNAIPNNPTYIIVPKDKFSTARAESLFNYSKQVYSEVIHIKTVVDLVGIKNTCNSGADSFESKLIVLDNDIDLSSVSLWLPIGTLEHPFKGSFDGRGHTISGLTQNRGTVSAGETGLFGVVASELNSPTYIQNFKLEGNIKTTGGANAGTVISTISFADSGYKPVYISGIWSAVNFDASGNAMSGVGGIVGNIVSTVDDPNWSKIYVTIDSCWYSGTLDSPSNGSKCYGGILGWTNLPNSPRYITITNCLVTGTLSLYGSGDGLDDNGGLVGFCKGTGGNGQPVEVTIESCVFAGLIKHPRQSGVTNSGYLISEVSTTYNIAVNITKCYYVANYEGGQPAGWLGYPNADSKITYNSLILATESFIKLNPLEYLDNDKWHKDPSQLKLPVPKQIYVFVGDNY